jgi:chromosome segregation ATPase
VALKKPSDLFTKKESSVVFESSEISSNITETYDRFRDNLNKVNVLSEQIEQISQRLSEKMTRTDLENAMYSQLMILDENFKSIQNQVRGLNKQDLKEFKVNISNLTEIVQNLVENELPKYKKQVTKNEVRIGDKFDELKEVVEENIADIKEDVDVKVNNITQAIDNNLEYFNNQLQETSSEVKKTTDTYNKLSKILESKILKENKRNDLYINEKIDDLKEDVEENIVNIRTEVGVKVDGIKEVIDTNLESFNNQLQKTSFEVKNTTDTYNKLSKIVESKVLKENEKLEEYSQVIQSLHEAFTELEKSLQEETSTYNQIIEEKFETISSDVKNKIDSIDEEVTNKIDSIDKNIKNKINSIDEEVDTFKNQVSSEVSNIKADVVIFEKHNKDTEKTIQVFSEQLYKISEIDRGIISINEDIDRLQNQYDSVSDQSIETKKDLEVVERYIQNHHRELVELKEEVFGEIEQIPVGNIQENLERLERKIDYIKETYSKIEPQVIVKEVIKEGLLNEPPNTKNSDPLTPLDQKFVTQKQLESHYSLFINRIQQQLSTLGGGGETQLKYLDDIVGIATNPSVYDGKYLQWNSTTNKAEFVNVSGGQSYWVSTSAGIHTLSNVGIGTTLPTSALTVVGNVLVTGVTTSTSFNSSSDINLKKDIIKIENPLETIEQLRGVKFTWKSDDKKSIGVIAQEVEKVLPELVSQGNVKSVDYNGVIAVLIEAIKELSAEVLELKNKLNN